MPGGGDTFRTGGCLGANGGVGLQCCNCHFGATVSLVAEVGSIDHVPQGGGR